MLFIGRTEVGHEFVCVGRFSNNVKKMFPQFKTNNDVNRSRIIDFIPPKRNPKKHNILVFLSNTLFSPFYVPSPSLFLISKNGRYLGGTWEVLGRYLGGTFSFHLRYFFAFQSIPKRSSIEDKAKFYRRPIEHLSKTYRTSIEDLSKKGWRGSGESRGRFWLQSYKIPKPHFHLFGR